MHAKQVIKKTLQALPTKISRRTYLKTLGIKFNNSTNLFENISGGATGNIHLEDFICPITQCIFIQPVVAADGFTYEKTSLDRLDMYPIRTSSGVVLDHRHYIPNMIVRNAIRHLVSEMATNPEVQHFFEENWNYELANELGIPMFTVPSVIQPGAVVGIGLAPGADGLSPVLRDRAQPTQAENTSPPQVPRLRRLRPTSSEAARDLLAVLRGVSLIVPATTEQQRRRNSELARLSNEVAADRSTVSQENQRRIQALAREYAEDPAFGVLRGNQIPARPGRGSPLPSYTPPPNRRGSRTPPRAPRRGGLPPAPPPSPDDDDLESVRRNLNDQDFD